MTRAARITLCDQLSATRDRDVALVDRPGRSTRIEHTNEICDMSWSRLSESRPMTYALQRRTALGAACQIAALASRDALSAGVLGFSGHDAGHDLACRAVTMWWQLFGELPGPSNLCRPQHLPSVSCLLRTSPAST
jgi:hypothetical protein